MERMVFWKYNSSLYELYNTLIDLEEVNLVETDDAFITRDHSVHSVNIYLLGLYLYFSFGIFNKQIKSYFSSSVFKHIYSYDNSTNVFLSFFNCWAIFSLNHDIGYPLEVLIDNDGNIKYSSQTKIIDNLNLMTDKIANEFSLNEIVFFVGLQVILKTSNEDLIDNLNEVELSIVKDINKLDITEYTRLNNIISYNIFDYYKSAFTFSKMCFIVNNHKTLEKYLCYSVNNVLYQFSFNSKSVKEISEEFLKDPQFDVDFYYPKKFFNNIIKTNLSKFKSYEKDIVSASSELLSETTISFAGIVDEASYIEFLYDIYTKIKSNLHDEVRAPTKEYYNKYLLSFNEFIKEKIFTSLSNFKLNINYETPIKDVLFNWYSKLAESINSPDEQKEDVVKFLKQEGTNTSFNLKPLFIRIKSQYTDALAQYKESCFLKQENNKISFKDYSPVFKKFMQEFVNGYGTLCVDSGLIDNIDKIASVMSYHPNHSLFDHGLASCLLTLENYFKISVINDYNKSFFFRRHNIDIPSSKVFTTATYSILVHNIYTSFWNELSSKKNIKHSLIKNPFVYFCLFCDNLQIWDRPYRVNQGKIELNAPSLSSKDISIIPTKNKLCIQCISLEAEKIVSNFQKDLDDYLKDASKLISLNISEKF